MHLAENYLNDYKTVPNLLTAFPIFVLFSHLRFGTVKWINISAKPALAVYLVHQGPGIIHPLWFDLFQCKTYLTGTHALEYFILVLFMLYILVGFFDTLCYRPIERCFLHTTFAKRISSRLDNFFAT